MVNRHRELKDAQARVNEAVERLVAAVSAEWSLTWRANQEAAIDDLAHTWRDFQLVAADLDAQGAHSHRDTSANAAKATPFPAAGSLRRRIIQTLVASEISFRDGRTCHELEAMLGKTHQNTSPQVNFLENAGWIRNSGRTRNTPSGRPAIVWVATDKAKAACQASNLGAAS
jgi:hypothetical protein